MKKELYIIGAGDFGREVAALVERINNKQTEWCLKGFIDDNSQIHGEVIDGYSVIGGVDYLLSLKRQVWVVCAVGNALVKRKIIEKVKVKSDIKFATLIDPSVICFKEATVGEGSIICAGNVLAINTNIGNHVIVNLSCTLGHDCIVGDYVTIYPGVNVSGTCKIGDNSELGTGAKIIQGKTVCENVIIGAGAVIVKDILESGTYVGVPARKVR